MDEHNNPSAGPPQGEDRRAVPATFFVQMTMGAFFLVALVFAGALPSQLRLPSLALAVATATPEAVATPTATPRPRIGIVVQPTATPLPTPTPDPRAVERYQVGNTDGQGVWLRRSPRLADTLVIWPEGALMEIVGEDATGEGLTWKQVRDPAGNTGYIPAQYLVQVPNQ